MRSRRSHCLVFSLLGAAAGAVLVTGNEGIEKLGLQVTHQGNAARAESATR